jgi:lipopolysaccharide transport system permease protein
VTQVSLAVADFIESKKKYKLWAYLGWSDIQLRYKGSILGPLWITLSMSVFIAAFGFVYGSLFHQPLQTYIPFLTCGILVWSYISTTLIDSCDIFYNSKNFICQIKLPYLMHIYRLIWRQIIIFLHNSMVYIVVAFAFHVTPNMYSLLFFPGFLLITINLACLSLFLSIIATRFRDIPPVISSVIQIVFFVSPITWMPSLLGRTSTVIKFNPVYYFIDIIRSPLLGQLPEPHSWSRCILLTVAIFLCVIPFFVINRRKIPYWL